jgi:RND superfamily putative drug exporter
MVRLRWAVLAAWLVFAGIAAVLLAPHTASTLQAGGFVARGSESARANELLERDFQASTDNLAVVVFSSDELTVSDPVFRDEVTDAAAALIEVNAVSGVRTVYDSSDPSLASADGRATVALVALAGDESAAQEAIPELRERLEGVRLDHFVTGEPAVDYDLSTTAERDVRRAELFTIPIALLLLLLVFRTVVAAAIPVILGGCAVVTGMAILYLVALQTDTSIFALNVTSMIGLGLGIDFSLLVVNRFREELAAGRTTEQAIGLTIATAGRSITYSAITVSLAMLVMALLVDLVPIRSVVLAVAIVALAALVSGLTLLPALLAILGQRVEWLRVIPQRAARTDAGRGVWYRLSHTIMRRPWLWLAGSLALLLAIATPLAGIATLGGSPDLLPAQAESARGAKALEAAFGANRLTPVQVVIRAPESHGVWEPAFLGALRELTDTVRADGRVLAATSLSTAAEGFGLSDEEYLGLRPDLAAGTRARATALARLVNTNGSNDTAILTIVTRDGEFSDAHQGFIRDLREEIVPSVRGLRGYEVAVGGDGASFLDFEDQLYGRFPVLVAAIMALTFVILMLFFGSVFLPLKAILMNLVSIAATYGVLVLVFQHGVGASLLGFEAVDGISTITPAILFAILFSLSTDYEVFMLSRVKEQYQRTGDNSDAVAWGLQHTAGVITAAGLILVGTFGSFATAGVVTVKEIGVGLAVGVLIDATVVRVILVPATMRLMGEVNWWMPGWLRRIVPELSEGPSAPAARPHDRRHPIAPGVLRPALVVAGGGAPVMVRQLAPSGPVRPQARWVTFTGQLVPQNGSILSETITVPRDRPLRIGRDASSGLRLRDPRISRRHAQIEHTPAHYILTDLGSTNGVYVNDARLTTPVPLRDGDTIELGQHSTAVFTFRLVRE